MVNVVDMLSLPEHVMKSVVDMLSLSEHVCVVDLFAYHKCSSLEGDPGAVRRYRLLDAAFILGMSILHTTWPRQVGDELVGALS